MNKQTPFTYNEPFWESALAFIDRFIDVRLEAPGSPWGFEFVKWQLIKEVPDIWEQLMSYKLAYFVAHPDRAEAKSAGFDPNKVVSVLSESENGTVVQNASGSIIWDPKQKVEQETKK